MYSLAWCTKTGKALARLNAMIREREFQKIYWAICRNEPVEPQGHLLQYLYKNEANNKSYICPPERPGAQKAELYYKVIGHSERYALIEVELCTGRHHQIRVQLAGMGCPIQGDLKYGDKRSNPDGSISLHARYLRLIHPVRKTELRIEAPTPQSGVWPYFC